MPIEIRELTIKAMVSDNPGTSQTTAGATSQQLKTIKEEIKKECLQELKQFINDQNER